jgi:uncharacterized DUF497 family protein
MHGIRYEWDDAKNAENLEKHGIAFKAILDLDWRMAVSRIDQRHAYGEERVLAFAPLDGRLHAVVYTIRGGVRRIVSLRKANRREQATYAAALLARVGRG